MNRSITRRLLAAGVAVVATLAPLAASASQSASAAPVAAQASTSGAVLTPQAAVPAADANKPFTGTKEIVRDGGMAQSRGGQGISQWREPTTNNVTVKVSKTAGLRSRERVAITWSGAIPSSNRTANPYGFDGRQTEHPVVILQCRGKGDDPSKCWTNDYLQRRSVAETRQDAIWLNDKSAQTREAQAGLPAGAKSTWPKVCQDTAQSPYVRIIPFLAWDPKNPTTDKRYAACDESETMPSAAGISATFLPTEQYAFTNEKGQGSTQFEVRTAAENVDLGCSDAPGHECSIVVIPIAGLSCVDDPDTGDDDTATEWCNEGRRAAPGEYSDLGSSPAVNGVYWWSGSNWNQRFVVPITFGTPPSVCDLDSRAPVIFFGSWLLDQASLQWTPAYCLARDRFKYQHARGLDNGGFSQMQTGQGPIGAFVSLPKQAMPGKKVGYAPTAITTWSIGYNIDRRVGNTSPGELTELRLTPRLIAKLLTSSYPARRGVAELRADLKNNPLNITLDPEFRKLNPNAPVIKAGNSNADQAAVLANLSFPADLTESLTTYVSTDKDAMAFVNGTPDPYGMKVNAKYKGISLPRDSWSLDDDFVYNPPADECLENKIPWFSLLTNPQASVHELALSLLDGWPVSQTLCKYADSSSNTGDRAYSRAPRHEYGNRFMLAIIANGDSPRYGLRTAALESAPGKFVLPTNPGMAAAVGTAKQAAPHAPFTMTVPEIRAANGYPGTQIVQVAGLLQGLPTEKAKQLEQFVNISLTEGQVPGPGNGQLPAGYLPITKTGPTAKLYSSGLVTAKAFGAQTPDAAAAGSGAGTGGTSDAAAGAAGAGAADGALGSGALSDNVGAAADAAAGASSGAPSAAAGAAGKAGDAAGKTDPRKEGTAAAAAADKPTSPTQAITSWIGKNLLPILLLLGLIAAAVSAFSASRRDDEAEEEGAQ